MQLDIRFSRRHSASILSAFSGLGLLLVLCPSLHAKTDTSASAAASEKADKEKAEKEKAEKESKESNANPIAAANANPKALENANSNSALSGGTASDSSGSSAAVATPVFFDGTSSVQSSARPFGMEIVDKVQTAASDEKSTQFQKEVLPDLTKLLAGTLGETSKVDDAAFALDPAKLILKTAYDVRVYFIGEGAGYHNTLGFQTTVGGELTTKPQLIFPDASSPVSTYDPNATSERTKTEPLLPGDFVNLGKFDKGTALDFFLIADGANGGKDVYGGNADANPDRINHVVSFAWAIPGSSLLIIGFEDLFGGGDRDFNDLVFAIDIGAQNFASLTGTPEPAMLVTFGSFLAGVVLLKRKRSGHRSLTALHS